MDMIHTVREEQTAQILRTNNQLVKIIFSKKMFSKIFLWNRFPQLFGVTEQAVTAAMELTGMCNIPREYYSLQHKSNTAVADLGIEPSFLNLQYSHLPLQI